MATRSMLRNGMASPIHATMQRTGSTRSILKRPAAPLSPAYPFAANFSFQVSPSLRSSHIEFLPLAPSKPLRLLTTSKPSRSIRTAAKALVSYPRSPYPSAPLVPPGDYEHTDDCSTHRTRASSMEIPRRNKKGLTLGSPFVTPAAPTSSSLGRSVFSPSVSEGKNPAPLDLESRLSEAFWEVLTLEEAEHSADEVMYTALEYPSPSSVEPRITYADANGALWSPALPKPSAAVDKIRQSLMSPGKRSSISGIVRKDFTAPTPNDPSAAFPSFATAMEMNGAITYPSRVALEHGV
jgi:hypothetical protein